MDLSISNVISISVAQTGSGVGEYNTSNLALFSNEEPGAGFGDDGYKIYLEPADVATDFGTASKTYEQAVRVFSQQPNIKAANGYLVIIPMVVQQITLTPSGAPTSGAYSFTYDSNNSAAIAYDATAAEIEAAVQAVAGLEKATVEGTFATAVVISMYGTYGDLDDSISENTNTLDDGGAVTVALANTTTGETATTAITRTQGLIQYFGVIFNQILVEADMLAAAVTIQSLNKIAAFVSVTAADVDPDGMLDLLRQNSYSQSRGLFYGGTESQGLDFLASYMGRALSTNFNGSNTTQTMHLKDLSGVSADPSMTETLYQKCKTAGVDIYVSYRGVAKVASFGTNEFFDYIYNLRWFVGALETAGFNALAQLATKLPQTSAGMTSLKGAYRKVCERAVTNEFAAPGEWTSPVTFGNQVDFFNNIRQFGYYIYSVPVGQQSQADREARVAPLVQIAIKTAGAVHSSTVIVNVNK